MLLNAILNASAVIKLPEESYLYFYQQMLDYYHFVAYYYGMSYEDLAFYYGWTDAKFLEEAINQTTYNMALYVLAEQNALSWTEEDFESKYEEYVTKYLENNKEATREEACKYVDELTTQISQELTEKKVIGWALEQVFTQQ